MLSIGFLSIRRITWLPEFSLFPPMFLKCFFPRVVNSLQNNKILPKSKLACAEHKYSVAKMMISVLEMVENIVEKGDNSGCQF